MAHSYIYLKKVLKTVGLLWLPQGATRNIYSMVDYIWRDPDNDSNYEDSDFDPLDTESFPLPDKAPPSPPYEDPPQPYINSKKLFTHMQWRALR